MIFSLKLRGGFTAIELVVVISIVTIISSIVLISFSGTNEQTALNRSGQELALAIRDAQNKALGVIRVGASSPPAIGIQLNTNSSAYFIFSDADNNFEYDPAGGDVKIGPDKEFPRRVSVGTLSAYNKDQDPTPTTHSTAYITFSAPEAIAVFTDAAGVNIGERLEIELVSPSGTKFKTVIVRISGQITVK